ncbi:MAG: patatin family protein [Breznakia sp.]
MQKIGLICEGGGTKAAYTSGVLQCFLDKGIAFPYAVGISAGAENLLPFVSKQRERLEVTGVDATCVKGSIGLSSFLRERSIFGIEMIFQFIEKQTPLDLKNLHASNTTLDIGIYRMDSDKVEYYDQSYIDEHQNLVKASCALILLAKAYPFLGSKCLDAGIIDMIPIEQSIRQGNEKHVFISTKEENYVRKAAPFWQIALARIVYAKHPHIAKHLKRRHLSYNKQWQKVKELEMEGNALVLRPSKDMGITRTTQDKEKLKQWFLLGYQDTLKRLDKIQEFMGHSE